MEDAFRFALMALFEANEAICRDDPRHGSDRQHTMLDVPALLALRAFRARVIKQTSDSAIARWFNDYFEPLDQRLRLEIINPVQTKVHKYLSSRAARSNRWPTALDDRRAPTHRGKKPRDCQPERIRCGRGHSGLGRWNAPEPRCTGDLGSIGIGTAGT
jgi:hypothetical protein